MTLRAVLGWTTRAANIVALTMLVALTPLLIFVGYVWAPLVVLFLWLASHGDWRNYGTLRLALNLPLAIAVDSGLLWGLARLTGKL
ncbi:MAG: hypothetical protein ACM30I_16580 [Gemmatimonas sp.]